MCLKKLRSQRALFNTDIGGKYVAPQDFKELVCGSLIGCGKIQKIKCSFEPVSVGKRSPV